MNAADSKQTLVPIHQTTRRHVPKDRNLKLSPAYCWLIAWPSTVKTEEVRSSDTSVNLHQTTLRHIPEDSFLNILSRVLMTIDGVRIGNWIYWPLTIPVAPTLEHWASVKRFVSLQFLNPKRVGRTPWTGDQPVARPLPTQTEKKQTYIHTFSGIRTHDPSVRATEDSSCLRPRGQLCALVNCKMWK
jgi:hypothetical protein